MRAPSSDRRRILVALFGLVFTALGVAIAGPVTERYRVAYDKGEVACLPYRLFVIDVKDVGVVRGDFVSFRTHGLSAKYRPNSLFTKLVAGVPGDAIRIDASGVFVNDVLYGPVFDEVAQVLGRDPSSFYGEYRLGESEYFLVGTEANSFDSRFYGPVKAETFLGQTYGVW